MSRHALRRAPCNGARPLRLPIHRNTAARLSLQPGRRSRPGGIIRLEQPVSDEALRALQARFVDRVPAYVILRPGEAEPPTIVRSPPRRPPWQRPLLARSRW